MSNQIGKLACVDDWTLENLTRMSNVGWIARSANTGAIAGIRSMKQSTFIVDGICKAEMQAYLYFDKQAFCYNFARKKNDIKACKGTYLWYNKDREKVIRY